MGRWEPGSEDRLRAAALDLYAQNGFEQTTVADIARAARSEERTFFRLFVDKREVLFQGQDELKQRFVEGIAEAPTEATALEVVAFALDRVAPFFGQERQPWSLRRRQIIEANPPLMEREQFKMLTLSTAISDAFRERGVSEPTATLSAQSAVAIFDIAFRMWTTPGETRNYAELVTVGIDGLRAIATSP